MQTNPVEIYDRDLLKNKYAEFDGRDRRSEYWYFVLFNGIVSLGLGMVDAFTGIGFLNYVYSLAVIIPGIAVSIRRLHDTGRSGWWLLVGLIPFIGWIILIVFFVQDSDPYDNQYGPNPKKPAVVL